VADGSIEIFQCAVGVLELVLAGEGKEDREAGHRRVGGRDWGREGERVGAVVAGEDGGVGKAEEGGRGSTEGRGREGAVVCGGDS